MYCLFSYPRRCFQWHMLLIKLRVTVNTNRFTRFQQLLSRLSWSQQKQSRLFLPQFTHTFLRLGQRKSTLHYRYDAGKTFFRIVRAKRRCCHRMLFIWHKTRRLQFQKNYPCVKIYVVITTGYLLPAVKSIKETTTSRLLWLRHVLSSICFSNSRFRPALENIRSTQSI